MTLVISLSIVTILFLISVLIIINLLNKVELYEDTFEKILPTLENLRSKIIESDKKVKELDSTGGFESDDEIGFFFTVVKSIQQDLNQIILDISEEEK